MKILYIYRDPNLGFSIGRVFHPVEESMREIAEVDSICMGGGGYSLKALCSNIKKAHQAVKSKRYDIVHITGQEHYLIPFLPQNNLVVTVHDLGFTKEEHGLLGKLKHLLFVDSLPKAKQLTCISDKSRREVISLCRVKEVQIKVVGNCVDPSIKLMPKMINTSHPRILHIGTMEHKNLLRTVDALAEIPCHLRIIGHLNDEQKLKLDSSNIDYSVVSDLSDEEMHQEYYDCDIVSFPSLYEGFGMPIIEAQAAGRVVITSDLSPMKEIANGSAILVNPFDIQSMHNAYVDAINHGSEYIQRGFENVKRFQVSEIVRQYLDIYKEIETTISQ